MKSKGIGCIALFVVAVGFVAMISGGAGGWALNDRVSLTTATPDTLTVQSGVYLPASYFKTIIGDGKIRVMQSPGTIAFKRMVGDTLEIALPVEFGPGMDPLTLPEKQEHILRQLAQIPGDAEIDVSQQAVDANILTAMANDKAIDRSGEAPSEMFHNYLDLAFAEHAIDTQADLAKHALDKQAEVAEGGFASNVAIASSADWSGVCLSAFIAVAFLAGAFIVFRLTGKVSGGAE